VRVLAIAGRPIAARRSLASSRTLRSADFIRMDYRKRWTTLLYQGASG
jgi:hypothetical protein